MSKSIIVDEVEALQLEVTNARKTKTTLKDKIDEIDNNINTNTTNIGTLANLTTTTKTNLVNAVNEHDAEIGNLSTLTTTQKGSLVESVNELDGEIGTLSGLNTTLKGNLVEAINEIKSNVGGIDYTVTGVPSNLTTTDKTTLVAAINEHDVEIGDLTTLTTTEKTNLVGATNEIVSSLADIVQQKYYKTISKPYNGFNMYVPFSSTYGTYDSVIDNAVRLGAKCINICVKFNMASNSSETITITPSQSDVVNTVAYAKSKGLKVFIKPHMNYSSWTIYQNVVNARNWLTSYSTAMLTCVGWVKDTIDFVGISNELGNQSAYNLDLWQTLITNVRALNSNIKISCSMTPGEVSVNLYLPYVDYIGCNLYNGVNGDLTSNVELLKKSMFREYTDNLNYIDILHKKAQLLGKRILITEVGCLQMEQSIKYPSKWDYDTDYYNANRTQAAQTKYYSVFMPTFANDTLIDGVILWSLTDDFTPVGNIDCENIIKTYFGGDI